MVHDQAHFEYKCKECIALLLPLPFLLPPLRCLIKDFELRPHVLDLLQHVFIKQIVDREKILQKQLIELIDLNQQIGVVDKTRYCRNRICMCSLSKMSHFYVYLCSELYYSSLSSSVSRILTHHKVVDRFCYKTQEKLKSLQASCQWV